MRGNDERIKEIGKKMVYFYLFNDTAVPALYSLYFLVAIMTKSDFD